MACSCCTSVVTQAKLDTLVSRGTLETGKSYEIKGTGITLTAISGSEFDSFATRTMLVPKTYKVESLDGNAWEGVWHISKTVSSGDLMIWGGLVWKNLTGAIGTATNDIALDAVNWIVVPKDSFSNSEYIERNFKIIYDYANSWVVKQWDTNGNEFGISYEYYQQAGFFANPVDISDWNYTQDDVTNVLMANNKVIGIWNNVEGVMITGNIFNGIISNNNLSSTKIISNNMLEAVSELYSKISDNTCGGIYGNKCFGIFENSNTGIIYGNNIVGFINGNEAPVTAIRQNAGACDNIRLNTNNGPIQYNVTIGGAIQNNSNNGKIQQNYGFNIYDNSNDGEISFNICHDIYNNSNDGYITYNLIPGGITSNTIIGNVYENTNGGYIASNSGTGNIYHNHNNGFISLNALGGFNILHNNNNGDITGATLVANITDPVVNK